jgi:hypothetical protein
VLYDQRNLTISSEKSHYIIREISLFLPVYYPAPATINISMCMQNYRYESQVLGDRIPPFFVKKNFPVFFFLFGIFVINLCYIIREISLFHIIREISLFPQIKKEKNGEIFFTKKGGILSPSTVSILILIVAGAG